MKVGVIGSGHVGLVTAATLAPLGDDVLAVDSDAEKIDMLRRGLWRLLVSDGHVKLGNPRR